MPPPPLLSFVTPFYNTADYLAECIESVLAQTYENWEYILVNNQSSDGSREIAEGYAARFPGRIRLVHTPSFLSQVQNYNFALSQISPESKYCKMVQADDWLFPDCAQSMVAIGEAHPKVGIISAYVLEGGQVNHDGLPYRSDEVPGNQVCRLYFLNDMYFFGTPTSLLLRSDLVRARAAFYDEHYAPFEDAHVCFELLKTSNFGLAHQVLTYSRLEEGSFLWRARASGLLHFFHFSAVVLHGRNCLSELEYRRSLKNAERRYFLYLARCALRGRDKKFWDTHRKSLKSLDQTLTWWRVARWLPRALAEKTWETFWVYCDRSSRPVPDKLEDGAGGAKLENQFASD